MNRIVNFIIPFTGVVVSIVIDILLIKQHTFSFLAVPIEVLVIFILTYFYFQIIEFEDDQLVITRLFRRKRRIRYNLIKELRVTHYERKNNISKTHSSYKFEILIFDDEFFICLIYDELEKKKLINFFHKQNVPTQLIESFAN